jgi:hypothetical protein
MAAHGISDIYASNSQILIIHQQKMAETQTQLIPRVKLGNQGLEVSNV